MALASNDELLETLQAGANTLGLKLTGLQLDLMMEYITLLLKWNKVYNLTAIRDPGQMVIRHLLDSLAIAPWCQNQRFIDVGTGAGLPGIPLAILFPQKSFHLLDSNNKKTRFLFQVKTALSLDNINVHHARVEQFEANERYDVVLSRAFASLEDMVAGCRHLLTEEGQYFAMKGETQKLDLSRVETQFEHCSVHRLLVPNLDEQRHLVILSGNRCG